MQCFILLQNADEKEDEGKGWVGVLYISQGKFLPWAEIDGVTLMCAIYLARLSRRSSSSLILNLTHNREKTHRIHHVRRRRLLFRVLSFSDWVDWKFGGGEPADLPRKYVRSIWCYATWTKMQRKSRQINTRIWELRKIRSQEFTMF